MWSISNHVSSCFINDVSLMYMVNLWLIYGLALITVSQWPVFRHLHTSSPRSWAQRAMFNEVLRWSMLQRSRCLGQSWVAMETLSKCQSISWMFHDVSWCFMMFHDVSWDFTRKFHISWIIAPRLWYPCNYHLIETGTPTPIWFRLCHKMCTWFS